MRRVPAPLRFLVAVCFGWTALRGSIVLLAPGGGAGLIGIVSAPRATAAAGPAAVAGASSPLAAPSVAAAASGPLEMLALKSIAPPRPESPFSSSSANFHRSKRADTRPDWPPTPPLPLLPRSSGGPALVARSSGVGRQQLPVPTLPALAAAAWDAPGRRLSLSGWLFVRHGGTRALAPGGALGGSQAGARATYRLAGRQSPLALSLRVSSPLPSADGAEAAAGIDWKPLGRAPLHLLVERRQKLGPDGRSAFAATVYAGGETKLGPLRIEGYGQAGIVGAKRRDLFADGGVRAGVSVGRLRVGGGIWGAAQPGVSRLDVGPTAALRLGVGRAAASLSADWRFRIVGNARPGSGPALTLAAGF
jgi:hypothetical protein